MSSNANPNVKIVDKFGIVELYRTKVGATSWIINDNSNNSDVTIHELAGKIVKKTEKGFTFFSAPVGQGGLNSGGSRPTFRIDVRASGEKNGHQKYNYKTGAIEHGFCDNENDIGDMEYTIVARRRGIKGDHYVDFNIRGGDHHDSSPDSSCFQTKYPTQVIKAGTTKEIFSKELIHSVFDHFTSTAKVTTKGWPENTWMAFKAVSYVSNASKKEVTNRLYYDSDPIDFTTNPPRWKNNFVLVSEYVDKPGDTGNYNVPVTWAGCTNSIRIDNADFVDYAAVSIRSIDPVINDQGAGGGGSGGGGNPPPPPPPPPDPTPDPTPDPGPVSTVPILDLPQSNAFIDNHGVLSNKLNVQFIYWGSVWSTQTTPYSKTDLDTAMGAIFGSNYFDSLFQYRTVKRPVNKGSVINTTYDLVNQYNETHVKALILDCIDNQLFTFSPTDDLMDTLFVIVTPDLFFRKSSGVRGHHLDNYLWAFIDFQSTLANQTTFMIGTIVDTIVNNNPTSSTTKGWIVNPSGDFGDTPNSSLTEVCNLDLPVVISGATVPKYWSNEEQSCIAPTAYPTFVTCHTGATWDPVTQTCKLDVEPDPGPIPDPNPPPPPPPPTPTYVPSILAAPKAHVTKDGGGTIPVQMDVYFIFWGGTYWNSGVGLTTKNNLSDDIHSLFGSNYFDYIYQYRRIKRPILKGIVTNTTYTPVNNFTETNINALIDDCKTTGLIPSTTVDATKTLFLVYPGTGIRYTGTTGAEYSHKKGTTYYWGFANLQASDLDQDLVMSYLVVNSISDSNVGTGIILADNSKFPGHALGNELTEICSTQVKVGDVTVLRYWSDQDNACVAPLQAPTFISCPSGSTWNPTIQECVVDGSSGGGGTGGGGSGGGGTDTTVPSILATPKWHAFTDKGGRLDNPLQVIFIFWGSEWNTPDPNYLNKDQIMTYIDIMFKSNYFDGLYQYRKVKRPILAGSVVNTTFSPIANFKHSDLVNLINDCINKQLVPSNSVSQNNIAYFIISPAQKYYSAPPSADKSFIAAGHSWEEITPGTPIPYHIFGFCLRPPLTYTLLDVMEWISHELVEMITDNKPLTGFIKTSVVSPDPGPSSGGDGGGGPTGPVAPLLATPKSNEVTDHGGPVWDSAKVYFIFWGSAWNTQTSPYSRTQLTNFINTLMGSSYFDGLLQYKYARRPTIGSIITNTVSATPDNYVPDMVTELVIDSVNRGLVPAPTVEGHNIYYVFGPPNHSPGSLSGGAWHISYQNGSGEDLTKPFYIIAHNGWGGTFAQQTFGVSHELVEVISDPLAESDTLVGFQARTGSTLDTSGGPEIADVCSGNNIPDAFISGYQVSPYWSNEDNACIVTTSKPTWVSCPTKSTWNNSQQTCIWDPVPGGGGGTGPPPTNTKPVILATKKVHDFLDKGGPVLSATTVHFIFYGTEWNGSTAPTKGTVVTAITDIFNSSFFEGLIQYRNIKKPVLGQIVITTSPSLSSNFTMAKVSDVIDSAIDNQNVPRDASHLYVVITAPSTLNSNLGSTTSVSNTSYTTADDPSTNYYFVWAKKRDDLDIFMINLTFGIISAITNPDPVDNPAIVVDPKGPLANKGVSIVNVCTDRPSVAGHKVNPYWSDQDNVCIAPTTKPLWISCPSGYEYNNSVQACAATGSGTGGGGTGGDPGNDPGPVTPLLATPKTHKIKYGGQPQFTPLEVYFIFCGSAWNSGTPATRKTQLVNDFQSMISHKYFDHLFQYGFTQRPVFKASVVNTTQTLPNNFTLQNLLDVVLDSISRGQVPSNTTTKKNIFQLCFSAPGIQLQNDANVGGLHTTYASTNPTTGELNYLGNIGVILYWTDYNIMTNSLSEEVAETSTDQSADQINSASGYIADPTSNLNTTLGDEINDVCNAISQGPITLSGTNISVMRYWSDQAGACVAPTTNPTFVSCPSGSTWDNATQTCIRTSSSQLSTTGAIAATSSTGLEVADPCHGRSDGKGFVADTDDKLSVVAYWSDQDNACIVPQGVPNWISCPSGSTWDPVMQECVINGAGTSTGGGVGGTEGDPDPTDPNGGVVVQPEEKTLIAISKDWTFRLDVGVNSEDSCTIGNPLEHRDPVAFYDVSADTSDPTAFEELGYTYGNGVSDYGIYIATTDSIIYNQKIKKVDVKNIKRLIDDTDQGPEGYLLCYIYNFTSKQIMKTFGDAINVQGIDINDETLTFTSLDNEYAMKVGDMLLLQYIDDTASADRCLRIKRTNKDTIDSINSYLVIRTANGWFGNPDNDAAFTLYI